VEGRRPNVLLITSDQHRGDCLDFASRADGSRLAVQTPHLRRLAAEGVYFPNCYAESPLCVPARAVLQTGIAPYRSGLVGNSDVLPEGSPTLAGCLTGSGYVTQAIGKMHFRPHRARHGFQRVWLSEAIPTSLEDDDFLQFLVEAGYGGVEEPNGIMHELYMQPQVSQLPETHHCTAWTARKTIEFLRERAGRQPDQPFFCWTSFMKPHPPFEPPVPWSRLYRPKMAPLPMKSEAELAWVPRAGRSPAALVEQFPDPDRLAALWIYYFSAISFIDSWIGMLLDELERLGLREDTLVVYTSDHGELLGDHWSVGKSSFYDGSARVPCIFSWPAGGVGTSGELGGATPGAVREQLVCHADLVPTILEATGVAPSSAGLTLDGMSLVAPARENAPTRNVLIGQVGAGAQAQLAAIDAQWTYMFVAGEHRELLFRHRDEDAELHNYLQGPDAASAQVAHRLREAVQQRLRATGSTNLLDDTSPDGYRLQPERATAGAADKRPWIRERYYARWIQDLPDGWQPPPAPPDGAIPADLPLRSDRARYTWPPMAL
jgi:arylsulfatase